MAHILAPEAFGMVATVTMITSFAEMLSDAGFQKYLIQREFPEGGQLDRAASVAFWSSLSLALAMWAIIFLARDSLAVLVGNPGLGNAIAVACISLPLTALVGVQVAIYRRKFLFKSLFRVRVLVSIIPLLITVPFAIYGWGFWSIIIGTIVGNVVNAIMLTIWSAWKPSLFFSLEMFREMLSFSVWTLVEAMSIWLTAWIGTFIAGSVLDDYYLGLYKTSIAIVNSGMGIVTNATTPILFSALSRLQNDEGEFGRLFYSMQKKVALFVVPLGIGLFVFRDFATIALLGDQWKEASIMLGWWALSSSLVTVFSYYASEVYRAKGMPRLSFYCQMAYLAVQAPVTYVCAGAGFTVFAIGSSLVRFAGIGINFFVLRRLGFAPKKSIKNVGIVLLCSLIVGVVGEMQLLVDNRPVVCAAWVLACLLLYVALIAVFPSTRSEMASVADRLVGKCRSGKGEN